MKSRIEELTSERDCMRQKMDTSENTYQRKMEVSYHPKHWIKCISFLAVSVNCIHYNRILICKLIKQ